MRDVRAGLPQTFETSFAPDGKAARVPRHVLSRLRRDARRARRVRRLPGHHATQGRRGSACRARALRPPDRRRRFRRESPTCDTAEPACASATGASPNTGTRSPTALVGRPRLRASCRRPPTRRSSPSSTAAMRGEARRFDLVVERPQGTAVLPGRSRPRHRCDGERAGRGHHFAGRHGHAPGEARARRIRKADADGRRQPAGADRLSRRRRALSASSTRARSRCSACRRPNSWAAASRRCSTPSRTRNRSRTRSRAPGRAGTFPADRRAERAHLSRARRAHSRPGAVGPGRRLLRAGAGHHRPARRAGQGRGKRAAAPADHRPHSVDGRLHRP